MLNGCREDSGEVSEGRHNGLSRECETSVECEQELSSMKHTLLYKTSFPIETSSQSSSQALKNRSLSLMNDKQLSLKPNNAAIEDSSCESTDAQSYQYFNNNTTSNFTDIVSDEASTSMQLQTDHPCSSDQKDTRCLQCNKTFSNLQNLTEHIQRIHLKDRLYSCTECDKSFTVSRYLKQHVKHVHATDSKFQCNKCEFSSRYSKVLQLHISSIHLNEKPHECPHCQSCFTRKHILVQHIRSIHNNEKPYACSACDKRFSRPSHLDLHCRSVHCGEKPFPCQQCGCKFSQKSNLTMHQRSVHKGEKRNYRRKS